ncbi:MAG: hypothetical protein U0W65_11775 [Bacteroidia bacterium]
MKNKNLKTALMRMNEAAETQSSEIEIINPNQALSLKGGETCTGYSCGTNSQCNGKVSCKLTVCNVNLWGS